MNVEEAVRELRLAEQEILRQSLEEKAARVLDLERELESLRRMMDSWVMTPRPMPQPAASRPVRREVPRRWRLS